MKSQVSKVLWVEIPAHVTENWARETTGSLYLFNWTTWKWDVHSSDAKVVAVPSPFEWQEFWAGVIDYLLADKGLPRAAVIVWQRHPETEFVRISVTRGLFDGPGSEPPPWYDPRSRRS